MSGLSSRNHLSKSLSPPFRSPSRPNRNYRSSSARTPSFSHSSVKSRLIATSPTSRTPSLSSPYLRNMTRAQTFPRSDPTQLALGRGGYYQNNNDSTTVRKNKMGSLAGSNPAEENRMKAALIARDFRSDTVTIPSDEIFDIMKEASRGDDVYFEDNSTNEFQDLIAKLTGKEAGLFCVSGTMTNQLAIRAHLTQPPHSVLCDSRAHVHRHEAGGIAFHSQATTLPIIPSNGHHLTLEDDINPSLILGTDIHEAPTKLVCLENTLSGMVFPQDEIVKIGERCKELGIKLHLDGARIWEVAAKTGKSLEELCRPFDTVSLCMSKGLGAPIGSVLVGPKELINKARWFRKMFGGGVRQSGGLAAAASHCLDVHLPILPHVHARAAHLARTLSSMGVRILLPVETNMLFIDTAPLGYDVFELSDRAKSHDWSKSRSGLPLRLGGSRIVLHVQTSDEAVEDLIDFVRMIKEEKEREGWEVDGEQGLVWKEEGDKHANGLLWEGLRGKEVQMKRKGVGYAGN